MCLSLDGRVALVTGAARGLGRVEALALARRGARVVAIDLLDASEVVEQIRCGGGSAVHAQVDLACGEEAAREAVGVALDVYGDVHVLVNNAGILRDRMSFNLSSEDWELVVAVNLSAAFYVAQAAAREWRARYRAGDTQSRAIVSTSSESGLYGNVGQVNYAAAKAGIAAMTLTLATELHRYGVRVNAIAPRARTPMANETFGELPVGEGFDLFAPEHVADVVAWLVSDAAEDVTGQVLVVHGGAIEVMRTWSSERRLAREGQLSDAELLGLREALFPDGQARRLAAPISELFETADDAKEMVR